MDLYGQGDIIYYLLNRFRKQCEALGMCHGGCPSARGSRGIWRLGGVVLKTLTFGHWSSRLWICTADPCLIGGLVTEALAEILTARKELAWLALASLNFSPKPASEKGSAAPGR